MVDTKTVKDLLEGISDIRRAFKFTDAKAKLIDGKLLSKIDTRRWKLEETFVWAIDYDVPNEIVIVPKGFLTDFGSIPRIFWPLMRPEGKISYILHDYLYTREAKILIKNLKNTSAFMKTFGRHCSQVEGGCKPDRFLADLILYQALLVEGMSIWKATSVFIALRLFGWYGWHNR